MKKVFAFAALVGVAGMSAFAWRMDGPNGIRKVAAIPSQLASPARAEDGRAGGHDAAAHTESQHEEAIRLDAAQIEAAGVKTNRAGPGVLAKRLNVPGAIVPASDRMARVGTNVVGIVAEMRKRLGDEVAQGEVIAVLNSREVADAKSEVLAATVNRELQQQLFDREQQLFKKGVSAEQQFLRARTVFTETELRSEVARHKLSALGVPEAEIAALNRRSSDLQRYELRAPIAGRVVERLAEVGGAVGMEGQPKELYALADLSRVWVDLAVSPRDLAQVREGQAVRISSGGSDAKADGLIVFVSPTLNAETRSARVIAEIPNAAGEWRSGAFVTAGVVLDEQPAAVVVPRAAIQTIEKEQVVFVRDADGFEKRIVAVGRSDGQSVEILSGLQPGDEIVTENAFILKAELGKAEASHDH